MVLGDLVLTQTRVFVAAFAIDEHGQCRLRVAIHDPGGERRYGSDQVGLAAGGRQWNDG